MSDAVLKIVLFLYGNRKKRFFTPIFLFFKQMSNMNVHLNITVLMAGVVSYYTKVTCDLPGLCLLDKDIKIVLVKLFKIPLGMVLTFNMGK